MSLYPDHQRLMLGLNVQFALWLQRLDDGHQQHGKQDLKTICCCGVGRFGAMAIVRWVIGLGAPPRSLGGHCVCWRAKCSLSLSAVHSRQRKMGRVHPPLKWNWRRRAKPFSCIWTARVKTLSPKAIYELPMHSRKPWKFNAQLSNSNDGLSSTCI